MKTFLAITFLAIALQSNNFDVQEVRFSEFAE